MKKAVDAIATTSKSGNVSSEETAEVPVRSEIIAGMQPEFYKAAVEGNIHAFKEKGKQIESILTPNKNTILHIHFTNKRVSEAFVEGMLGMCPALVMKANAKDETILHIAARYGHSKIVSILIERAKALFKDIDEVRVEKELIEAINDEKETALHKAVRYHHTKIVDILTREDPDYSYSGNSDGETPLYIAAEREYLDVVDIILKNCNSLDQNGPNGRTALHAAVLRGNKEIVSKLLTRTSATADENDWVPLHLAALHESPDLAEVLLKHDRSMAYMRDKKGRTALHFAARCGNARTLEMIIEYCPDCSELVDEKGYNALHHTATINEVDTINAAAMIMKNESLSNLYNEKDKKGNTPLHHVAKFHKILHLLLCMRHPRVDLKAFNKQNQTAIDIAYGEVLRNSSSILKSLPLLFMVLQNFGVRFGGRVIKKDAKKKEQEEIHDSAVDRIREANFVVATLIAGVTFAAGFTLPGGTIQEGQHQGSAILKRNAAFKAFVITDSLSFVFAASSVLCQILSLIFPPATKNVWTRPASFTWSAYLFTLLAIVLMIIAFVTGTYAVLSASKGFAIATLLIGLSFFIYFCPLPLRQSEGPYLRAEYMQLSDEPDFSQV